MKQLQGTVTSLKNEKTAQVSVVRQWQHPLYKKLVKRTKKLSCHYEKMTLQIGDEVTVKSCRPVSKTKHFEIVKKVETKV